MLHKLYIGLLTPSETQPVSEEMQTRIFNYGLNKKDWKLLEILAAYNKLTPKIDKSLGTVREPSVAAAWCMAHGHTGETVVARLKRDKRVVVAMLVARRDKLPWEACEYLSKRPEIAIANALAVNTARPLGIRLTAIRKVVTRAPEIGVDVDDYMARLCRHATGNGFEEALRDAVAETALYGPYLYAALRTISNMRVKDIDRIIDRLVDIHNTSPTKETRTGELVALLGRQTLTGTQRALLIANVEQILNTSKHHKHSDTLQTSLAELKQVSVNVDVVVTALEGATTEDEIVTLAKLIIQPGSQGGVGRRLQTPRLLDILTQHPQATEKVCRQLFADMHQMDIKEFVQKLEALDDTDKLVEIISNIGTEAIGRKCCDGIWLLSSLTNKRQVILETVVDQKFERGELLPYWLASAAIKEYRRDIVLDGTPWEVVEGIIRNVPGTAALVEKTILNSLGKDQDLWDAFHTLSEGYEGSLDALLKTVIALNK